VITVLDAMGKDYILVETVGVGQDEVEIAATAYSTVVVTVPGLGDDIQAIKAGILEVADLLVVNKADREGANRTYQDLMQMLDLQSIRKTKSWKPRIFLTQAKEDQGIKELVAGLREHQEYLGKNQGEALLAARYQRVRQEFLEMLKEGVFRNLVEQISLSGRLEEILQEILAKSTDPYSASEDLITSILGPGK
jgi:LAO/AO transport system kinase